MIFGGYFWQLPCLLPGLSTPPLPWGACASSVGARLGGAAEQPAREPSSNLEALGKGPGPPSTVKITIREAVCAGFQFPHFSQDHIPTSSPVTPVWEPQAAVEVLVCLPFLGEASHSVAVSGQGLAAWRGSKYGCCCFSSEAGDTLLLLQQESLLGGHLSLPPPSPFPCLLLLFLCPPASSFLLS